MKTNVRIGGGQPLNKAFTLIELLAVIVILAIIALIATPIILDIISDAKELTNERTYETIEHATELYLVNEYKKVGKEIPNIISLEELINKKYIQSTDEDISNKIFIISKNNKYVIYYEGRDKKESYKSLKSLIEEDNKHIKKNVVVNGEIVNKVYGTKDEQSKMKNYVLYSGQLWEVIEINEEKNTIKLVSASSLTAIAYGNTNDWNTSWVKKWLYEVFFSSLERTDLIKETEICIDNIDVYPENYTKMQSCTKKINEKVGLLTYEDYIYAKDGTSIQNGGSFLDEDEFSWLITPTNLNTLHIWHTYYYNPSILKLEDGGYKTNTYGQGVRPVISLSDKVLVKKGKGTKDDPYVLSSERSLSEGKNLNLGKVGDYVYIDESNNPYVSKINETYISNIENKTSTSKIRYRIVKINEDGTVKVQRADILRNLPNTDMHLQFYTIDSNEGSTSCIYDPDHKYGSTSDEYYTGGCIGHNIYNPNEGLGQFELNTGDNIGYYLNSAPNSFYNWYSAKSKKMIISTVFNLYTGGYGKEYSNLNNNPNAIYPYVTTDGQIEAYVGLPSWGEMYTGNDLNISYWYINRWISSTVLVSVLSKDGLGTANNPNYAFTSVRPVVTLSSNVYIKQGNGTVNDPYTLDI